MGANASQLENLLGNPSNCHDTLNKRKNNAHFFQRSIKDFNALHSHAMEKESKDEFRNNEYFVCRKRPINSTELSNHEMDTVFCEQLLGSNILWNHKCGLRLDEKHMYIEHHGFQYDAVFNENDTTQVLYQQSIYSLTEKIIFHGGSACAVAFGATGSGKTYTMNEIALLVVGQCFDSGISHLLISCFEFSGEKVKDLQHQQLNSNADAGAPTISSSNASIDVLLREDESGNVVAVGARETCVQSVAEFKALHQQVINNRNTQATGVHDQSSRSHIMYKIELPKAVETPTAAWSLPTAGGVIYLTDLAGSEWSRDQEKHTCDRRDESKAINSSLLVFKRCLMSRMALSANSSRDAHLIQSSSGTGTIVDATKAPYRESKLTRMLKPCLMDLQCAIVVVATVSPTASDTEHTMNTLANTNKRSLEGVTTTVATEAAGELLLITNVPGIAHGKDHGQEYEGSLVETNVTDRGDMIKPEEARDCAAVGARGRSINVRDWNSSEVCVWFIEAVTQALQDLEEQHLPATTTTSQHDGTKACDESTWVCVKWSARQWVKLRSSTGDSIGLAFDTNAANALIVQKVLNRGYVTMCKRTNIIKPGYQLVQIQQVKFTSNDHRLVVSNELKKQLKVFKQAVVEWRKYDEMRPKYMTSDMEILRR